MIIGSYSLKIIRNRLQPPFDLSAMNEPVVINYNELEAALREREQWQGVWPAVRVIDFHDGKISTI